jgi:hypothetical protein
MITMRDEFALGFNSSCIEQFLFTGISIHIPTGYKMHIGSAGSKMDMVTIHSHLQDVNGHIILRYTTPSEYAHDTMTLQTGYKIAKVTWCKADGKTVRPKFVKNRWMAHEYYEEKMAPRIAHLEEEVSKLFQDNVRLRNNYKELLSEQALGRYGKEKEQK